MLSKRKEISNIFINSEFFSITKKISFRIFDKEVRIRIFLSNPDLDPGGKFMDPTDPNPGHCLNDQHKKVVKNWVKSDLACDYFY
jgi:hypothetical protein